MTCAAYWDLAREVEHDAAEKLGVTRGAGRRDDAEGRHLPEDFLIEGVLVGPRDRVRAAGSAGINAKTAAPRRERGARPAVPGLWMFGKRPPCEGAGETGQSTSAAVSPSKRAPA